MSRIERLADASKSDAEAAAPDSGQPEFGQSDDALGRVDDDLAATRRVLSRVGFGLFYLSLAYSVWAFFQPLFWVRFAILGPTALGGLVAAAFARRGHASGASAALLVTMWAVLTGSVVVDGNARAVLSGGYVVLIVAAGVLLGSRAAFVALGATAATAAGLWTLAERADMASLQVLQDVGSPTSWVVGTVFLLAAAGFVSVVAARTREGLVAQRARSRALSERNTELEVSRQRFQALAEGSLDLVLEIDETGRIIYCSPNTESVLGLTPDELVGDRPERWSHPDDLAFITDSLASVSEAGVNGASTVRFRHRDGTVRWFDNSAHSFEAGSGAIHVVCICRDVTEKRLIDARMQQAQKMESLGTLAGGVAHDLNNILTPVLGYAELAMDSKRSREDLDECLEQVIGSASRGRELVRQILAFSRPSAPKHKLVALHDVARDAVGLIRTSLSSNIEFTADLTDEHDVVEADSTELFQVIINLCANAGHALEPDGGTIAVAVEPVDVHEPLEAVVAEIAPGPYVRLSVADDGSGIEPSQLDRIFEPFFTTRGVGEGTGLGLAVVYGAVVRHRGSIRVTSTPGRGTTFEIYLPRTAAPAAAEAALRGEAARGRERVLVVDDEPAVSRVYEMMLSKLGYNVTCAAHPSDAIERFRVFPSDFDLIVSDFLMPGMTGATLARALLEIRPDIPIIIITGMGDGEATSQCGDLAISEILTKPVLGTELAAATRRALDASPARTPDPSIRLPSS